MSERSRLAPGGRAALPDTTGFVPDWPAPAGVGSLQTTRLGGVSCAPYAEFNLAGHVGDDARAVAANRARLTARLPAAPFWLEQVHGSTVLDLDAAPCGNVPADAAVSHRRGVVCAVLTADCLPVLLCNRAASAVGAAHAGWRGLLDGVLENTVAALGGPAADLLAWLGPAIGSAAFEVGPEVRAAFLARDPDAARHFRAGAPGKFFADLYGLARQRLAACGVQAIHGGNFCTYAEAGRFYSYRREGRTGRMASLIWLV
jgi:YfiH family protein